MSSEKSFETLFWCTLLAALLSHACCLEQQHDAPFGAFLGCFGLENAKSLPGARETQDGLYTPSTLYKCATACQDGNFSITIISPELRCWCAFATPDAAQQLPDSECNKSGSGAAVFYHHDHASRRKCRVAPTPLTADSISVDYNQHNVEFSPAAAGQPEEMRIQMQGNSGARVRPKCDSQMYGQFEVTAKVSSAAGAVTAFYVRDSDEYNSENKGNFEEIDVEFLNAHPGQPNSVWLNSYHRGLSRGERLVKPEEYQALLALPSGANNANTWLTYTVSWQPSHVMWAINGRPVLKRTAGQRIRWADMKGRPFERTFMSPDKPMHISFSMWSDSSRFHFGGELDYSKSPYHSSFRDLRRIECEATVAADDRQAFGPAWLYAAKAAWPKPATRLQQQVTPSPRNSHPRRMQSLNPLDARSRNQKPSGTKATPAVAAQHTHGGTSLSDAGNATPPSLPQPSEGMTAAGPARTSKAPKAGLVSADNPASPANGYVGGAPLAASQQSSPHQAPTAHASTQAEHSWSWHYRWPTPPQRRPLADGGVEGAHGGGVQGDALTGGMQWAEALGAAW